MSKITLPPLPEPADHRYKILDVIGRQVWSDGVPYGAKHLDTQALYTAEQMQERDRQVVEHVIRACAEVCAAEQAENRSLAKGSKTAMYDWMADGAGLCRGAILALLEPQA